jgi:hypothetical protein
VWILVTFWSFDPCKFVSSQKQIGVYPRYMAVVQNSRAVAAIDFDGLMVRESNGDEIHIESNACVVAKLLPGDAASHQRGGQLGINTTSP